MKLISLKGKYGDGKVVKVSDEDYEWVSKLKLHVSDKGYVKTYYHGKHRPLHQLIAGKGYDHENTDKLDCTRENLRPATVRQNNANVAARAKSGYKGVYHDKTSKKNPWHVQISVYDEKTRKSSMVSLGHFNNKHHAALVYDLWAIDPKIHGKFAKTNFPIVSSAD